MAAIPYAHVTQGPVIVQRVAPPPPPRPVNPLLPLCFIALILFLIASTIILALIPVYLKARGEPVETQIVPYTALYRINNGTLPIGDLVSENCATIQQDQQNLASSNGNNLGSSSPTLTSCVVTGNTTVTRRRRQSERAEGNLITLNGFLPGRNFCRRGRCLIRRAEIFIALLLNRGTFYLALAGANGTRFVFSITCISASFSPPINEEGSGAAAAAAASLSNDIAILNYALVLERLEANFYTRFQNTFNSSDFTAAGFANETYEYFSLIRDHENTHVRILTSVISQLGGTPVPDCVYNFNSVTNVRSYVTVARILENTGAMAYAGSANGIADPILREMAATVATVEARHSSYLNSLLGINPFPSPFENATEPAIVIQSIQPYITSCPFPIIPPTVPYVGSSSFTGTIPTTNDTSVATYTDAMYRNDLNALNFALIPEQLEATFYNNYLDNFTESDFTAVGYSGATVRSYFIMIREYESTHVSFLRSTINQRGGTPVPPCSYNFTVTNVLDFIQLSRTFENTGVRAYDGAIDTISDPNVIRSAATIATVEARFAAFLNSLVGIVPFPDATDPILNPPEVVNVLSTYQTCSFTPNLPVVLRPSTLVLNI